MRDYNPSEAYWNASVLQVIYWKKLINNEKEQLLVFIMLSTEFSMLNNWGSWDESLRNWKMNDAKYNMINQMT